jgi:hypothetical protein
VIYSNHVPNKRKNTKEEKKPNQTREKEINVTICVIHFLLVVSLSLQIQN